MEGAEQRHQEPTAFFVAARTDSPGTGPRDPAPWPKVTPWHSVALSALQREQLLGAIYDQHAYKGYKDIHGRVEIPAPARVVIATDAAVHGKWNGSGYLATSGHYGAHRQQIVAGRWGPHDVIVSELQVVRGALRRVSLDNPIEILCDSSSAIRYLVAWQQGSLELPPGYQGDALGKLAVFLHSHASDITITKVKGHSGHLLNETADSIAKLMVRGLQGHGRPATSAEYREVVQTYAVRTLMRWKDLAAERSVGRAKG